MRAALGATPTGLLRLIVGAGMRIAIIGGAAGGIVTFVGILVLRRLFTVVELVDAPAIAVTGAALIIVMVAASYLPARWAARLNPVDAVRCD